MDCKCEFEVLVVNVSWGVGCGHEFEVWVVDVRCEM